MKIGFFGSKPLILPNFQPEKCLLPISSAEAELPQHPAHANCGLQEGQLVRSCVLPPKTIAANKHTSPAPHDLLLTAPCVVFPAKRDSIILESNEPVVGDGDAMCISRQIVENMFRTSERRFGVDHPVFAEEESQERVESAGLSKALE